MRFVPVGSGPHSLAAGSGALTQSVRPQECLRPTDGPLLAKGEHMKHRTKLAAAVGVTAVALAFAAPAGAAPKAAGNGSDVARTTTEPRKSAQRGDQVLCPVDYIDVPESSSTGVVTEWLSYGESVTVTPLSDQIWAGVWFTGWNGPEGWSGTSAPWYYPAPGAREYSLVARLGSGSYQYLGSSQRSFTNTSPGYIQRVRFRVNDNTPGNGDGAFRVFVRYPCH